jgi:chaperonin GroEL
MKQIIVGNDARCKAVEALSFIADAVGATLGPKGLSFIIERNNSLDGNPSPVVSKDGISVMKSFDFTDPIQHAVHNFCVQASSHTVYKAGDGTTSTIVLAAEIAKGILKAAPNQPQAFARLIQLQSNRAIAAIGKEADKSPELAEMVALTSSNGDSEMVEWVMKAVTDNPVFGSIVIERSPSETERYRLIKQDGLTGGRGYNQHLQFAHSFSEKPSENSPFDIDSPFVLLYDGDLISTTQIAPIINALSTQLLSPWNLVIVAYEIGQEVANVLAEINLRQKQHGIKLWASSIRLSAEVNSGWHKLQDIASFTGATVINHSNAENINHTHLGECTKVQVTPEKTIFMGRSAKHWIPKRAMQNENGIENATTELDKERIKERNAELVSGLVKLIVGGGHMAGIGERADRCDDAIKAAQACFRSGALPGCGAAFIRAAELAEVGTELKTAFACIHKQIMTNFGTATVEAFEKDQTVAITESGAVLRGDFRQLKVADSYDTVAAVIRNATELGILFSTLGGYSLTSDLHEIEQIQRVKSMMG